MTRLRVQESPPGFLLQRFLFTCYSDKVYSFTDCTSFAVMASRGLFEAFTFDNDFQRGDFVVRELANPDFAHGFRRARHVRV